MRTTTVGLIFFLAGSWKEHWRAVLNFAEFLDTENRRDFSEDCIVALCEGKADAAFLIELAEDRSLNGIRIGFPDPQTADAFGKTGFGSYLTALTVRPGFRRHVKAIAIFADNDTATAFRDVVAQFPTDSYAVPERVGVRAEAADRVPSVVFLIPDDATGSLETLILRSSAWARTSCVEDYRDCAADTAGWLVPHHDKFRLRCIIAATCKDPESSTTMLWKKRGHPFSIKHAAFDAVAELLRSTRAVLDEA